MNKKGDFGFKELSFNIFWLVVLLIITLAFVWNVQQKSKDIYFRKEYLSKDITLLTDTIIASPGNIILTYDLKDSYDISIKNNGVGIGIYKDLSPKKYEIVSNSFILIKESEFSNTNKLILEKEEDIEVRNE